MKHTQEPTDPDDPHHHHHHYNDDDDVCMMNEINKCMNKFNV